MILVFEISDNNIYLKLFRPADIVVGKINSDKNQLLANIADWLKINSISIDQLEALAVVYSPASFSMLRGVTALANSLAWAKNIPVYKIKSKTKDDLALAKALKDLIKENKTKTFILPEYYKEPNITIAK